MTNVSGIRIRPAVLYLAHRVPFPLDKGERVRMFQTIRRLAAWADVHLAALADESPAEGARAALLAYCKSIALVPLPRVWRWVRAFGSALRGRTLSEGAFASGVLRRLIRRWALLQKFHAVMVSASSMVPYLRLPCFDNVRKVADLMDVDSQKWFDLANDTALPRRWLYRWEGKRLRRLEADLSARVDAVTFVSSAETELYRSFSRHGRAVTVPMSLDLEHLRPATSAEGLDCIFVGALDYAPNVDAVCWFCSAVWPEVRKQVPEATFQIVGRRPVLAVRRLADLAGVEVVGPVADVRPHLARAAVSVAPLRVARGVQVKVLEALALGKAVVASPETLKGIEAQPGKHLVRADSAADWVRAVVRLLRNPEERVQLGCEGRRFVEANHDAATCLTGFDKLLGRPDALHTTSNAPRPSVKTPTLVSFARGENT